jgi:predicted flap endonuclease-1-like 5' DNA nuclease
MRKNAFARFTATALIVAAVILFIVGMIPVIALAVGGLGAGWGTGTNLWLVGPLATCVCGSALFLLACGAMLLVLTRIQGNLTGWRQRQAEAAAARAAVVPLQEPAPAALAAAAVSAAVVAPEAAEAPEQVVESRMVAEEAVAVSAPVEPGTAVDQAEHLGPGAPLAVAGITAAALAAESRGDEEVELAAEEGAIAAVEAELVLPEVEAGEPAAVEAEVAPPEVKVGASEVEGRGVGVGAVLAGAGIAAAAVMASRGDEEAEAAAEEETVAAAEGEVTLLEADVSEPVVEDEGLGLGAALAGAGIAAAAVAAGEEEEPEPSLIPESAPPPEPGAPSVEFIEAETPEPELPELPPVVAVAAEEVAAAEVTAEAIAAEVTEEEVAAAAKPTRQVAWAYDDGTSKVTKAVGAVNVEGIGQVYAGKLKELGITTTAALLRAGATPKGRKELAEKTGISPKQILTWVNHVDLARIRGISGQYAELLEAAGVDTVPALAQRNADNLLLRLTEINEAKRLVRRLPTLGMVASWIAQAKDLPRIVVYK